MSTPVARRAQFYFEREQILLNPGDSSLQVMGVGRIRRGFEQPFNRSSRFLVSPVVERQTGGACLERGATVCTPPQNRCAHKKHAQDAKDGRSPAGGTT